MVTLLQFSSKLARACRSQSYPRGVKGSTTVAGSGDAGLLTRMVVAASGDGYNHT